MAVWSRSVRSTTNIVSINNNIGLWTRPLSITFDFWKIINTTVTEHLSLIPLSKLSWKWSCTKVVNLCPKPDIFHFWNYLKLFCDDHTWVISHYLLTPLQHFGHCVKIDNFLPFLFCIWNCLVINNCLSASGWVERRPSSRGHNK